MYEVVTEAEFNFVNLLDVQPFRTPSFVAVSFQSWVQMYLCDYSTDYRSHVLFLRAFGARARFARLRISPRNCASLLIVSHSWLVSGLRLLADLWCSVVCYEKAHH